MPGYVNYSPWEDAANFGQGATTGMAQLALQIPQMRAQQFMMKQHAAQIPYQTDLLQAQAGEARARTGEATARGSEATSRADLYDEQTKAVTQKTDFNAAGAQSLGEIFAAVQAGQTPSPEAMVNIGKFLASKNPAQVAEMMKTVTAMGASHLASNPALAQSVVLGNKTMGVNIPSGGMYHPLGGGQNVQAPATVPIGGMRFDPNSPTPQTPVAVNTNMPPHSLSSALNVALARGLADGSMTTNDIPAIKALLEGGGPLGQPGGQAQPVAPAQPAVPPPQARPIGMKVSTAKGTFQWTTHGWDPVAPQQAAQ